MKTKTKKKNFQTYLFKIYPLWLDVINFKIRSGENLHSERIRKHCSVAENKVKLLEMKLNEQNIKNKTRETKMKLSCENCVVSTSKESNLTSHTATTHKQDYGITGDQCNIKTKYKGDIMKHHEEIRKASVISNCEKCGFKAFGEKDMLEICLL